MMNSGHILHTATLLPNGKVLIVAGYGSSCELYDPTNETWTATSAFPYSTTKQTATLLPNGKVLIAGGENSNNSGAYSNAFLFDPSTETWTQTGSMHEERRRHTATLLPNGKVLVAAGWGNSIPRNILPISSELYDPATETWTLTGSLNFPRRFHTATLLPNGKVLVAGGEGTNGVGISSAELYDPISATWTVTGQMSTSRLFHSACLLPNGKVLISGGGYHQGTSTPPHTSAEIYDPITEKWTPAAPMTKSRWQHNSNTLMNGQVLVGSDLYIEPSEFALTNITRKASGAFQFEFTNLPGAICDVLTATNISLPLSNWTALSSVTEISPGQFQFTDPQATNNPQRFYRIRAN